MSEHKFNNEYDVILWTIFLLLDRFEKEDQLFTAQCIWWLASMIQFMEILIYYRHYQIFPSDYVINCVVTPLSGSQGNKIPEGDIPESSLERKLILNPLKEVDSESPEGSYTEHPSRMKYLQKESSESPINKTRSGKVFKPHKLEQKELKKRYPGWSNKQLQMIPDSLWKHGLIIQLGIIGWVELTSTVESE